jgi:hypothetical protein
VLGADERGGLVAGGGDVNGLAGEAGGQRSDRMAGQDVVASQVHRAGSDRVSAQRRQQGVGEDLVDEIVELVGRRGGRS